MTFTWLTQTARLVPLIVGAVHATEAIASVARGRDKQQAAVEAVHAAVAATELAIGRDLLNDEAVDEAVRGLIDAYVALQNVVAARHAEAAPPAS
jgi:hypothetical protein